MDKFIIGYIWILSVLGALFMGHEFGMVEGSMSERTANKNKLESCQRVLAGNMYAHPAN